MAANVISHRELSPAKRSISDQISTNFLHDPKSTGQEQAPTSVSASQVQPISIAKQNLGSEKSKMAANVISHRELSPVDCSTSDHFSANFLNVAQSTSQPEVNASFSVSRSDHSCLEEVPVSLPLLQDQSKPDTAVHSDPIGEMEVVPSRVAPVPAFSPEVPTASQAVSASLDEGQPRHRPPAAQPRWMALIWRAQWI
ncbi:hypothetical protein XELAEV_18037412mg [Xenopus laevis]|uniref:Uncharacterized protein n=1 Tax=Xenopus laevis TaxID=8355 RepID=A0A974CD90_XENLA|nr:hypothetical protein XELAEV_18037412mg [Xenopus laevis]